MRIFRYLIIVSIDVTDCEQINQIYLGTSINFFREVHLDAKLSNRQSAKNKPKHADAYLTMSSNSYVSCFCCFASSILSLSFQVSIENKNKYKKVSKRPCILNCSQFSLLSTSLCEMANFIFSYCFLSNLAE